MYISHPYLSQAVISQTESHLCAIRLSLFYSYQSKSYFLERCQAFIVQETDPSFKVIASAVNQNVLLLRPFAPNIEKILPQVSKLSLKTHQSNSHMFGGPAGICQRASRQLSPSCALLTLLIASSAQCHAYPIIPLLRRLWCFPHTLHFRLSISKKY
ncbi:hypothetical protein GPALN_010146 [Globodera pallida]|nr:hypothetical protein GPALN_010146 [Globodera pallida]